MTRFTETAGVAFTEESVDGTVLGRLHVRTRGQNSTLIDLKVEMARQAQALGGNAVVRFTYVQTADQPLRNVFSLRWDTERLIGTGDVMRLEPGVMQNISVPI